MHWHLDHIEILHWSWRGLHEIIGFKWLILLRWASRPREQRGLLGGVGTGWGRTNTRAMSLPLPGQHALRPRQLPSTQHASGLHSTFPAGAWTWEMQRLPWERQNETMTLQSPKSSPTESSHTEVSSAPDKRLQHCFSPGSPPWS